MADRFFSLDLGVKQTLEAVLPSLPSLVDGWMEQVRAGEIDEQFRDIAVALGWITQRDSRVRPVSKPRAVKATTVAEEFVADAKQAGRKTKAVSDPLLSLDDRDYSQDVTLAVPGEVTAG